MSLSIKPGDRYGRLVVVMECAPRKTLSRRFVRYFSCRCDCGKIVNVRLESLRNSDTKSCGCLKKQMNKKMKLFWTQYRKEKQQ